MKPIMDLADRVATMRKTANVSNRELDRLANITEGHSWLIEDGRRQRLTARIVAKLAETLGCSMEYLVTGKGEHPTDARIAEAIARARAQLPHVEAVAAPEPVVEPEPSQPGAG